MRKKLHDERGVPFYRCRKCNRTPGTHKEGLHDWICDKHCTCDPAEAAEARRFASLDMLADGLDYVDEY